MKKNEKISWEVFKQKLTVNEVSYLDVPIFITESSFSEFLNCVEDYIYIRNILTRKEEDDEFYSNYGHLTDLDDSYFFSKLLNQYKSNLKFKLNVVFKNHEIHKKIELLYDSYKITITLNGSNKPYFKYLIDKKLKNKKRNLLKEYLYNKILEFVSDEPLQLNKMSYYGENNKTALQKSIFELLPFFINNELTSKPAWQQLTDVEKKQLFILSILLHVQLSAAIYSTISKFLDNSFHFGPVRETPKFSYNLINEKFGEEEYYSLLNQLSQKDESIYDPINEFINDTKLEKAIHFDIDDNKGKLKLELNNKSLIDLGDAPSGLIQMFPIIAKTIMRKPYYWSEDSSERFSIEQPELHLHPKLQTQLTEFIVKNGNLLIETHSEHIIRKLQIMFAKGEITDKDVNINYFDNKSGKTRVKKMEMEENGFFKEHWPDGFFDESYSLTKQLLKAQRD